MSWVNLSSVSVTNSSKVVSINDGLSSAGIRPGDGIQIKGFELYEVDGVFAHQLTLKTAWSSPTQTNAVAVIVPTFGDFNQAVEQIRNIASVTQGNMAEMEKWWTEEGTVTFTAYDGQQHQVRTAKAMQKQVDQGVDTLLPEAKRYTDEKERWGILPQPLNRNAFMYDFGKGPLDGLTQIGNVKAEAVSPYTKGFEGPYTATPPSGAAANEAEATGTNPYWFGHYHKGPRVKRGGIADGWGSQPGGHILKIHKPEGTAHTYSNRLRVKLGGPFKRRKFRFRGYVWIEKGPSELILGLTDSFSKHVLPSRAQWHFVDHVFHHSEITHSAIDFNFIRAEEQEIYVAMYNFYPVSDSSNQSTLISLDIPS